MRTTTHCAIWLAVTLAAGSASPAPEEQLSAEAIVRKAAERHAEAYSHLRAAIRMTLVSAKGELKIRELEMMGMRTAEGLLRTLTRFRSPSDIAGTALLVLENASGPPEQYLYLSAFKKVRRIPGADATVSFMGSDFTFLDLNPALAANLKDVFYERLPDTTLEGTPVYVAAIRPQLKGAPYSKLIMHVHKDVFIPLKIEFFDGTGAPHKVMTLRKLQEFNTAAGTRVVPLESEMRNLQRGSTTVLALQNVNVEPDMDPRAFAPDQLAK
jgi:hypothetical protein